NTPRSAARAARSVYRCGPCQLHLVVGWPLYRSRPPLAAARPGALMASKGIRDGEPNRRTALDLCAEPYSEFENQLKLLRRIVPAIVVAQRMRGKIVLERILPAGAASQHVV